MAGAIPQTGLSQLGQVLLASADDYANRQNRLTDEARERAQRLADIDSARQYETGQYDKIRNLQLGDEQRRRREGLEDASSREALQTRFGMLQEALKRGLIDASKIGKDQAAEDAAIQALAQQLARESEFNLGQPAAAQARLAELTAQEQAIVQKMSAVEARLSAQPTIDPAAVNAAALQIATQMNGGQTPSREQIAAALPEAQQQAQQRALQQWYTDKEDARVQFAILSNQLNTIRQQQGDLVRTFKVAPTAGVAPSSLVPAVPVTSTSAPSPGGRPIEGFINILNGAMDDRGLNPAINPSSPESVSLRDTASALRMAPPEFAGPIRQTQTNRLAGIYEKLDDPVNRANAELADINAQKTRIQMGMPANSAVTQYSPFYVAPGTPQSTVDPGTMMTRLLQREAQVLRQRDEAQRLRQQGKTAALSQLSINTPRASTPPVFTSPGSTITNPPSSLLLRPPDL